MKLIPPLVNPYRLLRDAREMEEQLAELSVEVVIDPFTGVVQGKYHSPYRKKIESDGRFKG